MKLHLFRILFIALTSIYISCERDDICAESTSTTPRLIIEFYDDLDPEVLKSVTRLTVYGEGLITDENGNEIEPESASSKTIVFNQNVNTVSLPLLIGEEDQSITTRYILEKDTNLRIDETGDSNLDILEISYTPKFQYVSRACGFKSIFTNLTVNIVSDGDNWITSASLSPAIIETQTLENENDVHVYLYH